MWGRREERCLHSSGNLQVEAWLIRTNVQGHVRHAHIVQCPRPNAHGPYANMHALNIFLCIAYM